MAFVGQKIVLCKLVQHLNQIILKTFVNSLTEFDQNEIHKKGNVKPA